MVLIFSGLHVVTCKIPHSPHLGRHFHCHNCGKIVSSKKNFLHHVAKACPKNKSSTENADPPTMPTGTRKSNANIADSEMYAFYKILV